MFAKYKLEVVYLAATHKHVPLVEDSPCESIKNNAIGTYRTAYVAMMNRCKRFELIYKFLTRDSVWNKNIVKKNSCLMKK